MRLSKRKRATSATMDITPMIDITFLLLIFFITVTQVSDAAKEQIPLPELEGEEDDKRADLTVNVTEEGETIVLGKSVTTSELVSYVGQELVAKGDKPENVKVLVRAARTGDSRIVNEVVKTLEGMGFKRVSVGVLDTKP
jgi:biopolymer transport protein ExbD